MIDDGTVDASSVVTTVSPFVRLAGTLNGRSGTATFDSQLAANATRVAQAAEQNVVATVINRETALANSKSFIDAVDSANTELTDIADIVVDRDYGSINSGGKVVIPSQVTAGAMTVQVGFSAGVTGNVGLTSPTVTYANTATASANKANSQRDVINTMNSPEARENFIKANTSRTASFHDTKGNSYTGRGLTAEFLGQVYDVAISRGMNAGAEQLRKR